MLDVFIVFGTFLALFFFIVGIKFLSGWAHFISAVIFLTVGTGIFTTGWQTQDNATITITDISSTVTEVTYGTTTFNPILDGTPVQQIVYVFAIFFITLSLVLIFLAIQQRTRNKDAKEDNPGI